MSHSPHSRPRRTRHAASLLAGALLTGAGAAHAQSTYSTTIVQPVTTVYDQFTVTTTPASPTYNRPSVPSANGSAGTPFTPTTAQTTYLTSYATSSYTPASTLTYNINTTFSGFGLGNFAQFVYSPSFSPTAPTTNAKIGIDDYNATSSEGYSTSLTAGTAYTFVNTGYFNASDTASADSSNGTSTTTISTYDPGSMHTAPDNSTTGTSQALTISDLGTVGSLNSITIDNLSSTFVGDLLGTLTHNGVTVDLFDHVNANNDPTSPNYDYGVGSAAAFDGGNYTFALSGASLAAVPDFTTAPDGTYAASGNAASGYDPANASNTLSAFAGTSLSGTWTLKLVDDQPDDSGASFLGFSLNVTPSAAPEPSQWASLLVGALGLGGLALRARRRAAQA